MKIKIIKILTKINNVIISGNYKTLVILDDSYIADGNTNRRDFIELKFN